MSDPLVLALPFTGRWRARNSPADRVPSHGTAAFGSSHAVDFVHVDDRGRSAPRGWRAWLWSEAPETFPGFGRPIVAPIGGEVILAADGEPDHVAHRSAITGIPYLLGQGGRARRGPSALAGNHVVIAVSPAGPFVLLAHLRRESIVVRPGAVIPAGTVVGACGNSGNSTEPHVHVQASDSLDWASARGVPIAFLRNDRLWMPRSGEAFDAS